MMDNWYELILIQIMQASSANLACNSWHCAVKQKGFISATSGVRNTWMYCTDDLIDTDKPGIIHKVLSLHCGWWGDLQVWKIYKNQIL